MSWSVEYTTKHNAEIQFVGDDNEEVNAAMLVAVEAVKDIVDSGVLGDPETKRFSVKVNGHTNPGKEPRSGWSNDYVTINVYQMEAE